MYCVQACMHTRTHAHTPTPRLPQAKANRGILYVDEVNLLDDGLVDVVLDSSASGVNTVEREGISIVHPAKFIMIGSGNPQVRGGGGGGGGGGGMHCMRMAARRDWCGAASVALWGEAHVIWAYAPGAILTVAASSPRLRRRIYDTCICSSRPPSVVGWGWGGRRVFRGGLRAMHDS